MNRFILQALLHGKENMADTIIRPITRGDFENGFLETLSAATGFFDRIDLNPDQGYSYFIVENSLAGFYKKG